MRIDVFTDAVCPWCFIGKRRLERALALRGDCAADIRWRPFQLNPWMPAEGMSRAEYLVAKFGATDASRVFDNIRRVGESEGIRFAFDRIERMPNTLAAHRLIRWAVAEGLPGGALLDAIFEAYFEDGLDIGDPEVLAGLAGAAGFDQIAAERFLTGTDQLEPVAAEDAEARQMGVQGVPCFIVDKRFAVSGAQEPEYFMPLFDLACESR